MKQLHVGIAFASTAIFAASAGAATVPATVGITAGQLAIAHVGSTIDFGTYNLSNGTTTLYASGTNIVLNVEDSRGSGAGWHVDISSDDFANADGVATHIISASGFKMDASGVSIIVNDGQSGADAPVADGLLHTLDSPSSFISADVNKGMGDYDISIPAGNWQLYVPTASTFSGTHTATVTATVVTAP